MSHRSTVRRSIATWISSLVIALFSTASAGGAPLDLDIDPIGTTKASEAGLPKTTAEPDSMSLSEFLDAVTSKEIRRAGVPAKPILLAPLPFEETSNGEVAFQWRDGDGGVRAEFFRLCVFGNGGDCRSPEAIVFPAPGEALLEGTSHQPAGGLPRSLQGERLQWTVEACAYDHAALVFKGGQPPLLCAAAPAREIDWRNPVALLLEEEIDPPTYPWDGILFRWDHADPAGITHQRFCMVEPGHDCGDPKSRVELITDPTEKEFFVSSHTQLQQEGRRVLWTVALCDASDDCRWSEPAEYTFSYRDDAFGALLPAVRDQSCVNCHSFGPNNKIYERHVDLGRFTRYTDVGNEAACAACHNPATGYPAGWHSPGKSLPLECVPMRNRLRELRRANPSSRYGGGSGDAASEHLEQDAFVRWAIAQNPNMTATEWLSIVDRWVFNEMQCLHEDRDLLNPADYRYPWLYDLHEPTSSIW